MTLFFKLLIPYVFNHTIYPVIQGITALLRKNKAAEGGKERFKMNKDINPRQLVNIRNKVFKIKGLAKFSEMISKLQSEGW
jgi:hypothetical protein